MLSLIRFVLALFKSDSKAVCRLLAAASIFSTHWLLKIFVLLMTHNIAVYVADYELNESVSFEEDRIAQCNNACKLVPIFLTPCKWFEARHS